VGVVALVGLEFRLETCLESDGTAHSAPNASASTQLQRRAICDGTGGGAAQRDGHYFELALSVVIIFDEAERNAQTSVTCNALSQTPAQFPPIQ
jgi:hypothetical protein